jgi:hypothetical protein
MIRLSLVIEWLCEELDTDDVARLTAELAGRKCGNRVALMKIALHGIPIGTALLNQITP